MATSTQIDPDRARAEQRGQVDREPVRDELPMERLDRNSIELMGQLRVAGTGVQVLLAFLLVVPFNARWSRVTAFDRYVYFVTLLCIATALLIRNMNARLKRLPKSFPDQDGDDSSSGPSAGA